MKAANSATGASGRRRARRACRRRRAVRRGRSCDPPPLALALEQVVEIALELGAVPARRGVRLRPGRRRARAARRAAAGRSAAAARRRPTGTGSWRLVPSRGSAAAEQRDELVVGLGRLAARRRARQSGASSRSPVSSSSSWASPVKRYEPGDAAGLVMTPAGHAQDAAGVGGGQVGARGGARAAATWRLTSAAGERLGQPPVGVPLRRVAVDAAGQHDRGRLGLVQLELADGARRVAVGPERARGARTGAGRVAAAAEPRERRRRRRRSRRGRGGGRARRPARACRRSPCASRRPVGGGAARAGARRRRAWRRTRRARAGPRRPP